MQKLLDAYRLENSLYIAKKLRDYDRAHPFASCMLTSEDGILLNMAIIAVERALHTRPMPSMTQEKAEYLALEDKYYRAVNRNGRWLVWCDASDHEVEFDLD